MFSSGLVLGVATVFAGAEVGVAAKAELMITVVGSIVVLVREVRLAVGLAPFPVATALTVDVF